MGHSRQQRQILLVGRAGPNWMGKPRAWGWRKGKRVGRIIILLTRVCPKKDIPRTTYRRNRQTRPLDPSRETAITKEFAVQEALFWKVSRLKLSLTINSVLVKACYSIFHISAISTDSDCYPKEINAHSTSCNIRVKICDWLEGNNVVGLVDVLSARVTQLIRHLREDRLAGAERRKKGNIEIRARGGIFLKRRAFRYGRRRSEQERSKTRSLLKQCTLLSPVYWGSSLTEIWW